MRSSRHALAVVIATVAAVALILTVLKAVPPRPRDAGPPSNARAASQVEGTDTTDIVLEPPQ